ncbi:cytochrome P450 [Fistulina hepatica ATCC 64428]|uniref:Cytochrome P450 n=1 Tax=Fistulina hepatica ATCC 64428 TaxID=1128425 RepID=A0A0D7ADE2_9AGAR|nr:cytochrome P450 [Fistulina hepatica ATCC 64428]
MSFTTIGVIPLGVTLIALSILVKFVASIRKRSLPLPPGPPGLPLIGNIYKIPTHSAWEKYTEWSDHYGDVICLHGLGRNIVIVNSLDSARALLDKKSLIYSDRPTMRMLQISGFNEVLVAMPYAPPFKQRRRLIQQAFGTSTAVRQYFPHIEIQIKEFVKRLLLEPDRFFEHIDYASSGLMLRATYGHVVTESDPLLQSISSVMSLFNRVSVATSFLVNFIPILAYVPSWFPGAGFKKLAHALLTGSTDVTNAAYNEVQENIANGTISQSSFTSKLIEKQEDETSVKYAAFIIYGAGFETSTYTMRVFFKAMVLYPEVQARAQKEIDEVIGGDRLPNCNDQAHLPYVQALVLEIYRWHCVVPTGFPHRVMEDDTYNGMYIPKGSIVMPNAIKISMDTNLYKDPGTFEPLRFIPGSGVSECVPEQDPREYIFGHGRRVCAGQALADVSMFMEMAVVLACFNISPYVDEDGERHLPNAIGRLPGTISAPAPFKCSIKPRNAKAEALLQVLDM